MEDDDEYELPLKDKRYFGAGIKRKRIEFVPASNDDKPVTGERSSTAADKYLSIVLEQQKTSTAGQELEVTTKGFCEICQKVLGDVDSLQEHEKSLVHQVALQHSHPPSSVDRKTKAFAQLKSQGWNADSRLGLGATGEGILHPIKAVENPARAGLGATPEVLAVEPKPVKLDAGKSRALNDASRKKMDALRESFYRNEAVDKLLDGS